MSWWDLTIQTPPEDSLSGQRRDIFFLQASRNAAALAAIPWHSLYKLRASPSSVWQSGNSYRVAAERDKGQLVRGDNSMRTAPQQKCWFGRLGKAGVTHCSPCEVQSVCEDTDYKKEQQQLIHSKPANSSGFIFTMSRPHKWGYKLERLHWCFCSVAVLLHCAWTCLTPQYSALYGFLH